MRKYIPIHAEDLIFMRFENNIMRKSVIRMMLKKYIFLALILCPLVSYGQFSANVKYLFGQSDLLDDYYFSQDGIHAAIEYGFRLKEKRLEFHPGLGYRFTFYNDQGGNYTPDIDYGYYNSIDLDFNTSIYPFDFDGGCDCPTWKKEGNLIKKGFFFEVSPGLAFQTMHLEDWYEEGYEGSLPNASSNLLLKISVGAGLDIGLSEEITLTPMFSWTKLSNGTWESFDDIGFPEVFDDQTYLSAGLRLAYKPDPKRRRRF